MKTEYKGDIAAKTLINNSKIGIKIERDIADSWVRCEDRYNIDRDSRAESVVLTANELRDHYQGIEDFLEIARAGVERLARRLNTLGYAVVLTDEKGVAINVEIPDNAHKDYKKAGLMVGAQWNEELVGTSGIGTALVTQRPLIVHQDEHFLLDNSKLSCSVCPIFDSSGALLACLDVSSLNSNALKEGEYLALQMVTMFARMIENSYFHHKHKKHFILGITKGSQFSDNISDCLLAVNSEGKIMGANCKAVTELGKILDKKIVSMKIGNILPLTMNQICRTVQEKGYLNISLENPVRDLFIKVQFPETNNPSTEVVSTVPVSRKRQSKDNTHPSLDQLCGEDSRVSQSVSQIRRIIDKDIPVLITGETGTGKEAFARAIHETSSRFRGPFVAMNCAAIPESLIESELFGYTSGSFTGALKKGMRGKLVQADGGTLFLDEIGDMPRNLQTRLLRVLAEKEVIPLGGEKPIKLDIQLISATHQNLMEMIINKEFREDLYYRLNGMLLELPSLRERTDRESLIHIIFNKEKGVDEVTISEKAMNILVSYSWPGNIRELQNVVRYALALCEGDIIDESCLSPQVRNNSGIQVKKVGVENQRPNQSEAELLLDCLKQNKWNITKVASELDVARSTIYRKIEKFNIVLPNELDY